MAYFRRLNLSDLRSRDPVSLRPQQGILRDEFAPDDLGLDLDRVHELDDAGDGPVFDSQDHRIMRLIIGQACRADAVPGCQGDGAVSLHDQFLKRKSRRLFEFRERRYEDVQQIRAAIGLDNRVLPMMRYFASEANISNASVNFSAAMKSIYF